MLSWDIMYNYSLLYYAILCLKTQILPGKLQKCFPN